MDAIDKILNDMKELDDNIPESKNCKECPYATNGVSRGMMYPCFDFCQGNGMGSIYLGEEVEAQIVEDEKWIESQRKRGLSGPEIAEKYKARCEGRRKKNEAE